MSDEPTRLTETPGAPPALTELVRQLDGPPPLPPELRVSVRGRLAQQTRLPRPSTRWIAPGVVAAAAAIAGLVLWSFRPPEAPVAIADDAPSSQAPELGAPPVLPDPAVPPDPTQPLEADTRVGDARDILGDGPRVGPGQRTVTSGFHPEGAPAEARSPTPAPSPQLQVGGGPRADAQLRVVVPGGWADVYVDGHHRGRTPATLYVPTGPARVVLRFPDGQEHAQAVRVPPDGAMISVHPPTAQAGPAPAPPSRDRRPPARPGEPLGGGSQRAPSAPAPPPGTRRPADVRAVLAGLRTQIQRCYERELRGGGSRDAVRVTVRIQIAASGAVTDATASGARSSSLHACVERVARGARFGAAASPSSVSYPIVFAPRDRSRRADAVPRAPPAAQPMTPGGTRGYLTVNASPWARVSVDGRFIGNTPVVRHPLPAGPHEVLLETADGRRLRRTVTVRAGENARVVHAFASPGLHGVPLK